MSRLTRDGTAETLRDQFLRHARGQGNINFPCSDDHEQDWQPYPVDPYSAICDDHTYIRTYIHTQEEGHTGFLIHLPSAVHAFVFLARRIQPFLSLVDREDELFSTCWAYLFYFIF